MDFIPAAGAVRIQLLFESAGSKMENVLHAHKGAVWSGPQMTSLANAVGDWWDTWIKPLVPTNLALVGVAVTGLTAETDPSVLAIGAYPKLGTGTGEALPGNVTLAVSWHTALRGRSFNGRTYHVGLMRTQVQNSNVLATPLANIKIGYEALINICLTQSCNLAVASYRGNGAFRESAVVTPIISVSVDSYTDSQRRRLFGRGQ